MKRLDKLPGSFADPFISHPWIHELTLHLSKREHVQVSISFTEEMCRVCNKLEDVWLTLNGEFSND